ncbi:CDK5 regulatory subunit-associated protein 2 isoform X2 [Corythoichthys intestinalis]|uniref:CDK5 regulatory subunit-associated protein 2 isoform X2 n=1 Tax=Corythoichthys intestinalis TaxID=161448 RepID=UPI0025A63CCA|nr:CDK5 regulatory subunit-associated protein 2 isoform X2 [Corythoichthys intestinalis]
MKDCCRVCGGRLIGNQCRWIFSSSAKRKLQIILSHVLGREVTRDGRGEFLCGKCVFQLEKVIQCDVNLSQLQEQHNHQVQKLQAEKAHLIQCIIHVYKKHNPEEERSDEESVPSKTPLRSSGAGSFDDEVTSLLPDDAQSPRESGGGHRMRRCVSLDRLAGKGVFPVRSSLKKWRAGSAVGLDSPMKNFTLRGSRGSSQSMYLDLVHYKGTFPRSGFKGRSASLQSLNRDFETPESTPLKKKSREATVLRNAAVDDPIGKGRAKMLLRSSSCQPSVIFDLIQLLRCLGRRGLSVSAGSRIPVLKKFSVVHPLVCTKRVRKDARWKSLHDLTEEFDDQYAPATAESKIHRLESVNKLLTEELAQAKSTRENLTKMLEETQNESKMLSERLDEKEGELLAEKKNGLKRDKTIQGLTQVLKEKEKEISELCHEIEDRDDALSKARETAHKAQMQKYQGAEEHQTLLMAKQMELVQLQGEHHGKVLEAQKLQRALERREQELADLQQSKEQLEVELEDLQQQKKKGDKALNDLNNQLKKLSGEIAERESSLEQQYQDLLDQTQRKVLAHEVTIQRLTSTLADKEQQLLEYMNTLKDLEQNKTPAGNDGMLAKLRQRLKEKERALERALDERFAAIEEKDNLIHQLQLSLREKERDMERLQNLLSHNEETISSFDSLIKEKDVEVEHLTNTLKNLQRAKQDAEDNLNRSLREKDSIISQLRHSLDTKTKDLEEMSESVLSQSQSQARDLAEQMSQRLKVNEAMLAEAVKARERLVADNEGAVEGLLATISSKDQLIKESAEHYNRMLSERSREIQELKRQLSERQLELVATAAQKDSSESDELRKLLDKKDSLIDQLLQRGQETEHHKEPDYVLDLRQTIQIMQEKLDEREGSLSRRNSDDSMENIPLSKKTFVVLKKELAQKTEALNKALKRENELKMALAELQSSLSELEGRSEGQAANIESLTATLETKDEIIHDLQQRLGQPGHQVRDGGSTDRSPSGLPQRERTVIGGDSQPEVFPGLTALQQEHEALNKALRAEQQLYSSLVRTVKEQDSAQRLHALQLELTAVQLLRQQLEDGVKANEELRDDLDRELDRAKAREGASGVDPKELESVRHQLEDTQRWNASLQARLGAIQNRGGGVGGTNDCGDTLSFIGDQTSYMSICVGEGHDDEISPQKVLELRDCISRLQALNMELQSKVAALEKADQEDKNTALARPWKQPDTDCRTPNSQDRACQTDVPPGQSGGNDSVDSGLGQSREHAQCAIAEVESLKCLLADTSAASLLRLREAVLKLLMENGQLPKEEKSSGQCKEKGSTEASGNGSVQSGRSRETGEKRKDATDRTFLANASEAELLENGQRSKISKRRASAVRSRLPVPIGLRTEACRAGLAQSALLTQLELLHQECQEKEELINKLSERLADLEELQNKEPLDSECTDAAESTVAQSASVDCRSRFVCLQKEDLKKQLGQIFKLAEKHFQEAEIKDLLLEIDAVNAALHRRGSEDARNISTQTALESLAEKRKNPQGEEGTSDLVSTLEMTKVLARCLNSAESLIASLAAACKSSDSFADLDLREHLDNLQGALRERRELERWSQTSRQSDRCEEIPRSDLRGDLGFLCEVLAERSRKICELRASLWEEREARAALPDAQGLAPSVQAQLEALHKALREKKKACENPEEKPAAAASPNDTARKALDQDDKGVQVDLQDLGYETTCKSENDREESSSTDLDVCVKASGSASDIPSLPIHEQARFSPGAGEHLDSSSSGTPYPSSPTLSSAKVSLRSPQTSEEYGLSEDRARARVPKVQIQRNRMDPAAGHPSSIGDGTQRRHTREKEDEGEDGDVRSEAERIQLQHARSRSTSPASLDSLVQSQARELSRLRQQIKESRRLGGPHRRQLAELSAALRELVKAGPVDCYVGHQAVKEQLDRSLRILDRLEGRLDEGMTRQDVEDVAALELSRRLSKELQGKNRLIENLRAQVRVQTPGSPCGPCSDAYLSDKDSCGGGSPPTQGGGVEAERTSDLLRENRLLGERLKNSEQLNASLRGELDVHLSVMSRASSTQEDGRSAPTLNSELLAEHLEEIRALRRRLEESICTNDRLREQLERRLAEVEQDTAATNIFIHGNEDQGQLVKEVHFLRGQNQALKEQLILESKDKERDDERLRDNLARCAAKLEQSEKESDLLRRENAGLREKLELGGQEKAGLLRSLRGLQCEVKLQRQQMTDSQRLLRSLRVELQVHAKMEAENQKPGSDAGDLAGLLSEIRQLRTELERSIRANAALRQKPEERSGRVDPVADDDGSGESAPSRLVPGHRLWADRNGRHVLALVEDYDALRGRISEGRRLACGLDSEAADEESDVSALRQVLDEAARLLKLPWRVSLPAGFHDRQDHLKKEISRLKSRLSQQERMLSGAVKRLRTTNQLKEGMERVIIDQLSLTHGVLKKARGNLERSHSYHFGPSGGHGGAFKWTIGGVEVYSSDEP